VSEIPPTVSIRPLIVIDFSDKFLANPTYVITEVDIQEFERRVNREIQPGTVVFLRTDWSKRWNEYKLQSISSFPSVSLGALKFLHEERGILMHGHEPIRTSMDPMHLEEAYLAHRNFLQAQGLTNLGEGWGWIVVVMYCIVIFVAF
jgi:kynurenine formamidase